VISALAEVGEIDLFALVNTSSGSPGSDTELPVARFEAVERPEHGFHGLARLRWLVDGRVPARFVGRDFSVVRDRFRRWGRDRYDLAWFGHVESYVALGALVRAPAVVDIDDLEDQQILGRLRALESESGIGKRLYREAITVQSRKNARLWQVLQRRIAGTVDAAVVCSDLDQSRLGVPSAHVIPNGYDDPSVPLGRVAVGDPATILFQGMLTYPPNGDAARYLVERVAPLVRARVPSVRIRLVGQAPERIRRLDDPPSVTVTGRASDISLELACADLVAVPIRIGSGTRIKILEAFAHRIPVVSTTTGAEGLGAVDGRHLLIGDTPKTFATACVELLVMPERRSMIVEEAHRLFIERFQWSDVRRQIADLATAVADGWRTGAGDAA
jgi:glycosyltransferase involved in cell wall biosynthesis